MDVWEQVVPGFEAAVFQEHRDGWEGWSDEEVETGSNEVRAVSEEAGHAGLLGVGRVSSHSVEALAHVGQRSGRF